MRKSNCLFSKLKSRILLALTVFALAFAVAGCDSPASVSVVPVQINSINDIKGVWEDKSFGNPYEITTVNINDVMMGCFFNIMSDSFVTSKDGYTLIFTQCVQGTQYTPTGNYYVIAVKKYSNGTIDFVCPVDYKSNYTTLSALQSVYTQNYDVEANGNWKSTCASIPEGTPSKVTFYDNSGYLSSKCEFSTTKAAFSMIDNSGGWYEYNTFSPTRDTSKETGNIALYLYGNRSYGADQQYCAIKNEGGTYYVYWYSYDDEEEDNDYMLEGIYPDFMPVVSADNLEKLKQMYQ